MRSLYRMFTSELMVAGLLAALVTGIASAHIIGQFVQTPYNYIFIGLPHYWEDYFYYLDQFRQGAAGHFLITNPFTPETYPPVFLYFWHTLFGAIGHAFRLTIWDSYMISVLLAKAILIFISYFIIRQLAPSNRFARMSIFLIYCLSTSLPFIEEAQDGVRRVVAARVLRADNVMTNRFGNVPSSLMTNILFIIVSLQMMELIRYVLSVGVAGFSNRQANRRALIILITCIPTFILLTMSDIAKLLVVSIASAGVVMILTKFRPTIRQLGAGGIFSVVVGIPTFFTAVYLLRMFSGQDIYNAAIDWDINEHIRQLEFLFNGSEYFIYAMGTIGIFFCVGIFKYLTLMRTPMQLYGFFVALFSLLGFFLPVHYIVPIPGFRFIFAASYIFFAAVAYEGIMMSMKLIPKMTPFVAVGLYLAPNIVSLITRMPYRLAPLSLNERILAYASDKRIDGFTFIRQLQPSDAVILAPPRLGLDLSIPAMTGKRVYSAHPLMTLDYTHKDQFADLFYYSDMARSQIYDEFAKAGISYVILTIHDGEKQWLLERYGSFLEEVFDNTVIQIFRYIPPSTVE